MLLVSGTLLPRRLHTPVLRLVAARLPRSSVVALNVGKFDADNVAYDAREEAVAASVLGHLYFKDQITRADRERKQLVHTRLRRNSTKPGYLARDEV